MSLALAAFLCFMLTVLSFYLSVLINDSFKMFFRDEVTRKLKFHSDEILAKQDQIDFNVTDKMKKSIQDDVTEIVKVISEVPKAKFQPIRGEKAPFSCL